MKVRPEYRTVMTRRSAAGWLVVAAGCWGLDTTLSAYALRELRPADLFLAETLVGSGAVWTYLWLSGSYRRPAKLSPHRVLGLIEPGIAYLLLDLGLRRTSAISGGLLQSTETILAVALAVIVLRERLTRAAIGALVAGFAGAVLVSLGGGHGRQTLAGDLLVLAGSATAASYFFIGRSLPAADDKMSGTGHQLLAALGVAVAYAAASWPTQGSDLAKASLAHVAVALSTGIVGIALPFFLLNRSLEFIRASTAALILNLIPVVAVVTAVGVLGESLSIYTAFGGLLILVGLTVLSRAPEGPDTGGVEDSGEVPPS